jgi:RNase P/RNase MRP subunit p29
MSLSISNESKNSLSITNESKNINLTWDEATFSWDDSSPMTWENQGLRIANESKNSLTITNESKN